MALSSRDYLYQPRSQLYNDPFSRKLDSLSMSRSPKDWKLDCKVYVGDLGYGAAKQELEDVFSRYGPLKNVWVARNPPGFAFVEFQDPRDADDSCRALDGTRINGRRVRVEMSSDPGEKVHTRRDGGHLLIVDVRPVRAAGHPHPTSGGLQEIRIVKNQNLLQEAAATGPERSLKAFLFLFVVTINRGTFILLNEQPG
ncbi:hypothetical protein ScPMuIL_015851 [Solemya velum]